MPGAEGEEEEDEEEEEEDDDVDDVDPVDEGSDVEAEGAVGADVLELGDEPPPHDAQISVLAATTTVHRMARASSRFPISSSRLRACEPGSRRSAEPRLSPSKIRVAKTPRAKMIGGRVMPEVGVEPTRF